MKKKFCQNFEDFQGFSLRIFRTIMTMIESKSLRRKFDEGMIPHGLWL